MLLAVKLLLVLLVFKIGYAIIVLLIFCCTYVKNVMHDLNIFNFMWKTSDVV